MKEPLATDRRVLRTRALLREALVALILERGWDAVSIREICERAAVGRSTFYTHYADKEDLLLSGFEDLRRMLRQARRRRAASGPARSGPILAFPLPLMEHAHQNARLFRALVGKRSGQVVEREFRRVVIDLTLEEIAELSPSPKATPARTALAHGLAGALVGLMTWWLDTRTAMSAGELQELFQRQTGPMLAAAVGTRPLAGGHGR